MHFVLKTAIQMSALMRKENEGAHFWSVSSLPIVYMHLSGADENKNPM